MIYSSSFPFGSAVDNATETGDGRGGGGVVGAKFPTTAPQLNNK